MKVRQGACTLSVNLGYVLRLCQATDKSIFCVTLREYSINQRSGASHVTITLPVNPSCQGFRICEATVVSPTFSYLKSATFTPSPSLIISSSPETLWGLTK